MNDRPSGPSRLQRLEDRAKKIEAKSAKASLEKLFSGSKIAKKKSSELSEIQGLRGKPEYYTKLSEFYKSYGTPLDWDLQLLFLDHRDSLIVVEVLKELEKSAPTLALEKQDLLAKKLDILELSTFDSAVLAGVRALKSRILR